MPPVPSAASVSWSVIKDRFNYDWCFDEESVFEHGGRVIDPYWWWAIDVRTDPNEIIAEGDGDGLWRIPFSTDGEDVVTFGDPVRVRETFVDVPEPAAAGAAEPELATVYVEADADARGVALSAARRRTQRVAASFTRPTKPAPTGARSAASARPTTEEASSMTDEQRRALALSLGLAEDATEEAIHEAAAAAGAETDPEAEVTEVEETETAEVETPPAAAAASGAVPVDRQTLTQLQADAAAGRTARDEQLRTAREAYLSAAVRAGKFVPAAKAGYAAQLAQGGEIETATRALIDSFTDGTVPLGARGEVPADAAVTGVAAAALQVGDDGLLAPGVSLLTPAQRARAAR